MGDSQETIKLWFSVENKPLCEYGVVQHVSSLVMRRFRALTLSSFGLVLRIGHGVNMVLCNMSLHL
jgi:hypothetical protein